MALKMRIEDESKMTKLPPTRPSEGSLIMYCYVFDVVTAGYSAIGENLGTQEKRRRNHV